MILDNLHIQEVIKDTGWVLKGRSITKNFKFETFDQAIMFVNQVGSVASEMQHHPHIEINNDRVKLNLTTQEEGGVSDKDITLAANIDELF